MKPVEQVKKDKEGSMKEDLKFLLKAIAGSYAEVLIRLAGCWRK